MIRVLIEWVLSEYTYRYKMNNNNNKTFLLLFSLLIFPV